MNNAFCTEHKEMGKEKTSNENSIEESSLAPLVISVKEARKIIGKELSDKLTDEELGRLIGNMSLIANRLLEKVTVQQNNNI